MSETADRIDSAFRRIIGAAVALIVVGAIIVLLGIGLDWGGLGGGFGLGAGAGLVVVGAYFWGYANGLRQAAVRAVTAPPTWLPSRGDRG